MGSAITHKHPAAAKSAMPGLSAVLKFNLERLYWSGMNPYPAIKQQGSVKANKP